MNKKGFTIVELIIVILILGLFAAIIIPTAAKHHNSNQNKSDSILINNLNKLLNEENITYLTCYDAIKVVTKKEYTLADISSSCGYDVAYNIIENQFVLLDEQKDTIYYFDSIGNKKSIKLVTEVEKLNYFIIKSDVDYLYQSAYSIYAGNDFNVEQITLIGNGFDAGDNQDIKKITYVNNSKLSHIVIIRTNSLTADILINANADSITHYGLANIINIETVGNNMYKECGIVNNIQITKGNIIIEDSANIKNIHLCKQKNIKPHTSDSFNDIKITILTDINIPRITRDIININSGENIKICTIKTKTIEEAIIFSNYGIIEQIKLKSINSERYATVICSDDDIPNIIAQMLANTLNGIGRDSTGLITDTIIYYAENLFKIYFDYENRYFDIIEISDNTLDNIVLAEILKSKIKENGYSLEK